jgi:hypothetical protein
MQAIGPYRIVNPLGTCPVGGVWSAVDTANNQVTVAMLSDAAANDAGWRRAFAATATALAQSRQVPLIAADYSGPIPWIASAARDGSVLGQVFQAVGMDYQPVAEASQPAATQPGPPGLWPQPAPDPIQGSDEPTHRVAVGPPTSSPPWQPPREPAPAGPPPYENPLVRSPQNVSPFGAAPPEPQRRRRSGLVIGLMVLVIALLVGGGLAIVVWPEDGEPRTQPSTEPTVQEPTFPPPSQPGVEPPQDGEWPADWPAFGPDEPANRMVGLIGERDGQSFQVPEGWDCPSVAAQGTFAHYTCGPDGDAAEIGGDLIIRFCPDPCDASQRDQMRTEVDAWGLQWVRDLGFRSWAETTEIDGEEQYGLVLVAYYRTTPEGRIDRQLVLRMTAPVDQADEIRKIANSVRDAIT